jgi:hypothetical protein
MKKPEGDYGMERKIEYFEKPGAENTETVIRLVKEYVRQNNIRTVVLASTRGRTAKAFLEAVKGTDIKLIVVPWQYGFGETHNEKDQPFPMDLADELRGAGHMVHFATMLFHTEDLYQNHAPNLIAKVLYIFGQGLKVCVEILMMAVDGGCVKKGEKVIAVAGTGSGADTAVVAIAASSRRLTDMQIQEILCKPIGSPRREGKE